MKNEDALPELKQIIGAMLFGAKEPVTVSRIKSVLEKVGQERGGVAVDFAKATPSDIRAAVTALTEDLDRTASGMQITEVANGYRLENDLVSGPWLRELLNRGKPGRLSRPALETLAIIAYRQPVTRGEIEAVRGVAVDQIVRNLLELQLIKAAGRSDLPGRPWLFGTTTHFMQHFGLKSIDDLPGVEELRRINETRAPAPAAAGDQLEEPEITADLEPEPVAAVEPSEETEG